MTEHWPDAADNSARSYDVGVEALRERLEKSKVEIGPHTLYCESAEFILPTLRQVDAIITDPPYHGVKEHAWDNQWRTDAEFLGWANDTCKAFKRILADNGSLYWFASPQMAARIDVEISKSFRVLNHIVWDKSETRKGAAGTGIDVTSLRAFWSANTERLIFAEQTRGDQFAADASGYYSACERAKTSIFGDYLRSEFVRADATNRQIAALFPSRTGGLTGCVSNWLLGLNVPTPEQYATMRAFLNQKESGEFLRREYEDLRREYEELRREYEELRRPFFLSQHDEWGDVWRFKIEREQVHPTQKPLSMMRHIIKTSSRHCNLVLDAYAGSGSTGVACVQLGRRFIGIERDPKHFATMCRRIEEATKQADLFIEQPKREKPLQTALSFDEVSG